MLLKHKGYIAHITLEPGDEEFHGLVINTRDVIHFAGQTPIELQKALEDSITDYLALCSEQGKMPDKPFTGEFHLRIRPELHKELTILARHKGVSLNKLIQDYLSDAAKSDLKSA